MNGQIGLEQFMDGCTNYKIKPLIYSMSLTCYKTICPYCHCDHPDDRPYSERHLVNICKFCGKRYDDENLDVRKSKDYQEVERLGLNGAVYKDEKGKWHEWKDPYDKRSITDADGNADYSGSN